MTGPEAAGFVRTMRRQLLLATLIRVLLFGLVTVGLMGAVMMPEANERMSDFWFAAVLAAGGWLGLAVVSARQMRATNQASVYMSTGRLDLAERELRHAMRLISLYRTGKFLICHNLAVVAHGRKNYAAAAELCDGLIAAGVGVSRGLGRMCRILLADCRLLLGEHTAADTALSPLRFDDPELVLSERLMLLPVQLRCQVAAGRFEDAVSVVAEKVRLAELLDSQKAALVHTLLARACEAVGKLELGRFLQRRADLYCESTELAEAFPDTQTSSADRQMADNNTQ